MYFSVDLIQFTILKIINNINKRSNKKIGKELKKESVRSKKKKQQPKNNNYGNLKTHRMGQVAD